MERNFRAKELVSKASIMRSIPSKPPQNGKKIDFGYLMGFLKIMSIAYLHMSIVFGLNTFWKIIVQLYFS